MPYRAQTQADNIDNVNSTRVRIGRSESRSSGSFTSSNGIRKDFRKNFNKSKYLLLLFLPAFFLIVIFNYFPIYGLVIAFFRYSPFKGLAKSKFVGFEQFRIFFSSPSFLKILRNTLLLGVYRLIWTFPAPIIFALIINEIRGDYSKKVIQSISYLPHFLSTSVIVSMTYMLLSPSTGMVATVFKSLGLKPIYFMANPGAFRTIYITTDIWQGMGWGSIIYLAAIVSINPELYESAVIDGANKFRQIIHITLPGISTTAIYLLILSTSRIVSVDFEKVYLLQNPMIYETSDVIATYVYRTGLERGNYSYGTAVGLLNSIVSFLFVYGSNFISRKYMKESLF